MEAYARTRLQPNVPDSATKSSLCLSVLKLVPFMAYCALLVPVCAGVGVVYHSAQAVRWKWKAVWLNGQSGAQLHALAWEHFKATLMDINGVALCGFLGIPYTTISWISPSVVTSWWFSSSNVRTGLDHLPEDNDASRELLQTRPHFRWGATQYATSQECPYNKIKQHALTLWEKERPTPALADNDPRVIRAVCVSVFEEAQFWDFISTAVWSKRPAFLSQELGLTQGQARPAYDRPWKTIAYVAAGIALLAILCIGVYFIGALFAFITMKAQGSAGLALASWYLISGVVGGVAGGSFVALPALSIYCCCRAVQHFLKNRIDAECGLAYDLLTAPATEAPGRDIQRIREGLYWFQQIAERGYAKGQATFGLWLLRALSYHDNAATMNLEELRIAREAICWLQAAGINDQSEEEVRHLSGWLDLNWTRICEGIPSSMTEEERHRKFLGALVTKNVFQMIREKEPNRKTKAIQAQITEVFRAPRRAANARVVAQTTQLPSVLANLIAEYSVPSALPAIKSPS